MKAIKTKSKRKADRYRQVGERREKIEERNEERGNTIEKRERTDREARI